MTDLARILVAPLVWLVVFSAVYGLQGLSQSQNAEIFANWDCDVWRIVLVVAWLAGVVLQTAIVVAVHHPATASESRFVRHASSITAWTALIAMLWTLFPVATLSNCS